MNAATETGWFPLDYYNYYLPCSFLVVEKSLYHVSMTSDINGRGLNYFFLSLCFLKKAHQMTIFSIVTLHWCKADDQEMLSGHFNTKCKSLEIPSK